ncbi:MAG: ribosome small subunit-dependent GTPase A [Phycisphaerae bacterium]
MNLEQMGWNTARAASFEPFARRNLVAARVARQDRDSYVIYAAGRAHRASVRGSLRHRAASANDLPVVGDWVAVHLEENRRTAVVEAVLDRSSTIARKSAGEAISPQPIAANVDRLLICCGLDGDFNLRRIERYLSVAFGCGVTPMVLLTKADLCGDLEGRVREVSFIAIGVPIVTLSLLDGARTDDAQSGNNTDGEFAGARAGIEAVRSAIAAGETAALLGSSGVGKSTLINRLLGRDELRTGAVRAHDSRGRHTTTHRQLLLLPSGGVVIDTPGMRELQFWGAATDVESAFADIGELAEACRFRDCRHENEPGCAVLAAVHGGELDAERLSSFHKQRRELDYFDRRENPAAAAEHKARWKAIHKAGRQWMRRKYGE